MLVIRIHSMKRSNEKGIGLVEVLAALGISVVVITSLVSLAIFTLRSSQRGKIVLEASKDANKTLELIRAYRDSESTCWGDSDPGTDCFLDVLISNGCHLADRACFIDSSYVVTNQDISGIDYLSLLGPEDVYIYFTTDDPISPPLASDDNTVRISVYAVYRIGNQVKSSNVYTDLTNWRDR